MCLCVCVRYEKELMECFVHTVTGCSQHELNVYNETIITLQSSLITHICTSQQQQQQQQQDDDENQLNEHGQSYQLRRRFVAC